MLPCEVLYYAHCNLLPLTTNKNIVNFRRHTQSSFTHRFVSSSISASANALPNRPAAPNTPQVEAHIHGLYWATIRVVVFAVHAVCRLIARGNNFTSGWLPFPLVLAVFASTAE
jgi:hypothetical protein